jgi:viologen exporter family transport system permease protein
MSNHPPYYRVLRTFFKNALIREMSFRSNFIITLFTRAFWFASQILLFEIIFRKVDMFANWTHDEYFLFMATGMLINAFVETFFMPSCANFSELIRTGNLDYALVKPIDTQFLVSFEKVNLPMLNQVILSLGLITYSLYQMNYIPGIMQVLMYLGLIVCGVVFFYSLMITLASTSIWFGRNQGLYDFWFYITVFARYPRGIYSGSPSGEILMFAFSYVLPILLVVTAPARMIQEKALSPSWLTLIPVIAAGCGLIISRRVFTWSLKMYRSASS